MTTAYRHLFITKTLTAIHIWTSGHHIHPSVNRPYNIVSFYDCEKSTVRTTSFSKWGHNHGGFFATRGYPHELITRARLRAEEKQRAYLLGTTPGSNCTATDRPPLVITYHLKNIDVCNVLPRNYSIIRDDDSTKVTFDKPPLKAFGRANNLKDLLGHSSLPQLPQRQMGTFPCNRRDCRTFPFVNSSDRITTTQGLIKISGLFTCITSQLIYCISCRKCPGVVYIGKTGRRPFSGAPVGRH